MIKLRFSKILVSTLTLLFSLGASSLALSANDNFQRGPNPTVSSLEAEQGPYAVKTARVSRWVRGFAGGTIYYPKGTKGKMGAIVIAPGFMSFQRSISWWGPRLASHGFVVLTINTYTLVDQPASRARQLDAALDYLISKSNSRYSAISGMVDSNRLGAMGWSMGGGGTLELAEQRNLKAAIPLAPWHVTRNDFDQLTTPTLIMACQLDPVAPVLAHALRFYNEIPSGNKAMLTVRNGAHLCANGGPFIGHVLGKYGVAWMKRYLDEDSRYDQFLCGPDHEQSGVIKTYRDNSCG